jgi:16S rRNA (uracil1498-N3)-methyltransferase
MNLILFEAAETQEHRSGELSLSGTRAKHLLTVLKLAPGDDVRVGVVDGPRGVATVRSIAADGTVRLEYALDERAPPAPRVDLLLALPRPKVMRRLWAQLAALGVGRIMLTNAARVERNYFDTHVLSPSRYRPLLIEGLQQARDTHLPLVTIHRQLKVLIEDDLDALAGPATRVVADPAAAATVAAAVGGRTDARVLLAIGPEGGWNGFETRLLVSSGFRPAGMGPRTLRTDTACVALLALVHAAIAHECPEK